MGQPQSLALKSYELITDTPSPATQGYIATNPYRVLVAVEDPTSRGALVQTLAPSGYDVLAFSDGRGVVEFLSMTMRRNVDVEPPDLLVAELDLPGASGIDVLSALRDIDWCTPYVLLAPLGDEDLEAEARRMGVTSVVRSPVDPEAMLSLVRELLPEA